MDEAESKRFRHLALPMMTQLYRLARALTHDRASADDLVQDTYLRAIRYFGSYRGEDMRAWLCAIMRNLNRSRGRRVEYVADIKAGEEAADPSPSPEQTLVMVDDANDVRLMLEALPPEQCEALTLREFGELSYQDIATLQGVPVGTVMSRIARARASLRRKLLP